MPASMAQIVVFLVGVFLTTALAAWSDWRSCRIPNALTVPAFVAGLVYQIVFHGWSGLSDAGLAFAVGFGTFFILWMVGGGGGGDVKLMGALSVWLGVKLTLYVMVVSTAFVVLGTLLLMVLSGLRKGLSGTQRRYLAGRGTDARTRTSPETTEQRKQRRIMAYAVPLAFATWVILWLDVVAIRGGQLGR